MKKYITLSASANGALLSVSKYQGVNYIIAPVISAVGDSVIFPANAPYPEFVPADVLALATESRNFRPVVMNHPWDDSKQEYCSANSPEVLEKYRYGFVFNSRFEDGRVKADIWLDPVRAAEVGPEALNVIERLQAGEVVEVSEGSYVIVDETPGIYNGDEYGGKWELCIPDHLATLSEGIVGACSVNKHGCGANRVSSSNQPDIVNQLWLSLSEVEEEFEFVLGHTSDKVIYCNTPDYLDNGSSVEKVWSRTYQVRDGKVILGDKSLESAEVQVAKAKKIRANRSTYRLRLSTLKQARTPKFTGTETTNWSIPTFSQYVRYLYPGSDGPKSVSQCSSELKREISAHSLLGDPEGKTLSDLTLFPVVNPSNGKLNEKALRNVISGKGKPDDLPESAFTSAIDTAKRLLNSEFGSSLEVSKVVEQSKKRSALSKFISMFRDNMSSNRLHYKLWNALLEVEPGLITIVDHDPDEKTVIYSTMIRFGSDYDYRPETEVHTWKRSFTVTDEKVAISDDKIEVEFQETYVPVKTEDDDSTLEVSSESEPEKPCSCKGDQRMAFNRDQTVRKLVASKKFTEAELKSTTDAVLKALEESLDKPAVNEPAEENKSADHGDKTIIENTPEDQKKEKVEELSSDKPKEDNVTLTKEEYEELKSMKPAADAFKASQAKVKESLVKVLSTNQTEYKEDELKKMDVPVLERMANMLKIERDSTPRVDYSFARSFEVKNEESEAPPVLSVMERIRAAREKKSA